jgi:hypothetical protein
LLTLIIGFHFNLPRIGKTAFAKVFSGKTEQKIVSQALNSEQSLFASHGLLAGWIVAVLLIVLVSFGSSLASMHVCRDKWGGMSFTNAPGGSSCKPYTMQKLEKSLSGLSRVSKLNSPKPRRTTSLKGLKLQRTRSSGPGRYDQEIWKYSKRYNVDPSLIKAIIHTESYFDDQAVSTAGAQGLMQLMPGTAKDLGVSNPFNPRQNIAGGTRYFRELLDSFNGNLILSLAAYNAGPGLVKRTGGVPRIPETLRYVNKVLKQYKRYKVRR